MDPSYKQMELSMLYPYRNRIVKNLILRYYVIRQYGDGKRNAAFLTVSDDRHLSVYPNE